MPIAPWSSTVNGSSPQQWTWTNNYGWTHYENYHFKSGSKTHVVKLAGGTPWRYPTSYARDILNIKQLKESADKMRAITRYPNGSLWAGTLFGNTSDVFYLLDCGGWSPGNVNSPNFDTNLKNGAVTKALNKLADQKVDLGSNIAEGRQTMSMVSSNSIKIFKAMLALKRGNLRKVAEELGMNWRDVLTGKFLANRWLEYQFGWKPLLADIHAGMQSFREITSRDLIVTGSSSMKTQKDGEYVHNSDWSGPWSIQAKASCRLDAFISCPELRTANQWNTINPLSVAWEVMPWSFAIDWFVPVGNVLEALTAKAGLQFLSGSVTQVRESHQEISFHGSGGFTIVQDGLVSIEKMQMRRDPLYDFPDPNFYAKTSNPFTSTHSKNALALWRQMPALR